MQALQWSISGGGPVCAVHRSYAAMCQGVQATLASRAAALPDASCGSGGERGVSRHCGCRRGRQRLEAKGVRGERGSCV